MVIKIYTCAQQELYTASALSWQSCRQHLPAFTNFSPRYDEAFIAAREAEIEAAENLPDEQARGAVSEVARIKLSQVATIGLNNYQRLKRYIIKAYTEEEIQKPMLEAAGQNYYAKAANEDWESCTSLFKSGTSFINAHEADLLKDLNMPPTFPTQFDDNKNDFTKAYKIFLDSEETEKIQTETKVTANNNVYSKLISMCLDGQEIFKTEDAIKKQFIFDQLLNLVSGTGTAGARGQITDSITGLPIAGATIKAEAVEKQAITDEEGKYSITQLAAGKYKITITAEGYQPQTILQEVKVGTISTLNIQLVKI